MTEHARPGIAAERHILAVLHRVEELLSMALKCVGIALPQAFRNEYNDFTADEVFPLSKTVAGMRDLCAGLGIKPAPATLPARWSAQTSWQFAEVALAEIACTDFEAWGGLDAALESQLKAYAEQLRDRLKSARVMLAGTEGNSRVTPEELAPGDALAPLRSLFRIDELAPLRGALRALATQLREVLAGTAWIETPGLGATSPALGAAAPLAVGSCDAVLLTIGAGSLPGLDEQAIIVRADRQGIPVHVLLAQTNRLRPEEQRDVLSWLSKRFANLSTVGAVSTFIRSGLERLQTTLQRLLDAPERVRNELRRARITTVLDEAKSLIPADAHESLQALQSVHEAANTTISTAVSS